MAMEPALESELRCPLTVVLGLKVERDQVFLASLHIESSHMGPVPL